MAYATVSDVASRWGKDLATMDSALTSLITVRLEDAERMIRRHISDLATRVSDADFRAEVVRVESEAVLRLARNPDGFFSEGDGNYQYQLMQGISSGVLDITPDEWEALGARPMGMFFIDPNPVLAT